MGINNKYIFLTIILTVMLSTGCSIKKKETNHSISNAVNKTTIPLTIGTYTKAESKGVYQADFNTKTGGLSNLKLIAEVEQPSFLTLSNDKARIYAVSEINKGKLSVFDKQIDGDYSLSQEVLTEGSTTCHVTLNKKESLVSVANYRLGSIIVYQFEGDTLSKLSAFKHQGSSVHFRQKVPHPHSTYFSKDEKYIYVPDLGTDEIISYPIHNGKPTSGKVALKMAPGDGPRHMAKHPTNDFWYVVGEISSVVWSLSPKVDGTFKVLDKQSLLPKGVKGRSTAADIHISPNGKYLYTSNRGHKSSYHCISVFEILKTGKLKPVGHVTEGINQPRNFSLSPDGKFLLVANQYGNNIIVFKVKDNGMLEPTEQSINVSMPACLIF